MLSGATASAPPLPARPPLLRRLGERGLMVLMLGVLVAVCLTLLMRQSFGTTLVYSLCISFFCWLFIDGGRLAAARWMHRRAGDAASGGGWPGWPWMSACLLLGTPAGYLLGNALANRLTGMHDPGLLTPDPHEVARLLVIALIPAAFACFAFYARARLAAAQAQAAAPPSARRRSTSCRLLQSQLEPHMLFNTLANLRVLIGLDPARAQAMLDRLIAFLRATLERLARRQRIRSAPSSRGCADYLELMQVRMGPRLRHALRAARGAGRPAGAAAAAAAAGRERDQARARTEGRRRPDRRSARAATASALVLEVRDSGVGSAAPTGRRHALRPGAGARTPRHPVRRRAGAQPSPPRRRRRHARHARSPYRVPTAAPPHRPHARHRTDRRRRAAARREPARRAGEAVARAARRRRARRRRCRGGAQALALRPDAALPRHPHAGHERARGGAGAGRGLARRTCPSRCSSSSPPTTSTRCRPSSAPRSTTCSSPCSPSAWRRPARGCRRRSAARERGGRRAAAGRGRAAARRCSARRRAGAPARAAAASSRPASAAAIHLVPVDEVLYFEAADKYVRVVTREREHLIRLALRELLPQLDAQPLLADPPRHGGALRRDRDGARATRRAASR